MSSHRDTYCIRDHTKLSLNYQIVLAVYVLNQCAQPGKNATPMCSVTIPLHAVIILDRELGYLSLCSDSLRAGRSGIESQRRRVFSHLSRPALVPTKPLKQRVRGLFRG